MWGKKIEMEKEMNMEIETGMEIERRKETQREGDRDEAEREIDSEPLSHFSVHQWVRFAIHASQQLTSPIGFLSLKLPSPAPSAVFLVYHYL